MDLLDRLLAHDAWTTALLLRHCHHLSEEQLDAGFDIGPRSVRATLVHVVLNLEMWADLMAGRPVRAVQGRRPWSINEIEERHRAASASLAAVGREVTRQGDWDR